MGGGAVGGGAGFFSRAKAAGAPPPGAQSSPTAHSSFLANGQPFMPHRPSRFLKKCSFACLSAASTSDAATTASAPNARRTHASAGATFAASTTSEALTGWPLFMTRREATTTRRSERASPGAGAMPRIAAFTRASAGGPCAAERAIAKRGEGAREGVETGGAGRRGRARMHHWREPRAIPGRIAARGQRGDETGVVPIKAIGELAAREASRPLMKKRFVGTRDERKPESQIRHARRHDRRASRLLTPYRTWARSIHMDASILAKFPDDDLVLGPFLGNLPPEILDVVVQKLGWFQTTFAMAGRTCREAVKRVPDTRVDPRKSTCMYAARDPWAISRCCSGRVRTGARGKGRARWEGTWRTCSERVPVGLDDVRQAAQGGHLEVLQWARQNGCPWDE